MIGLPLYGGVLFNSYPFIFLFLPIVVVGYFTVSRVNSASACWWLAIASLIFYGFGDWRHLPVLLASIVFNYRTGSLILATSGHEIRRKWLLRIGVGGNLATLCLFKYLGFFAGIADSLAGRAVGLPALALPVGISFFTFTQIAYLVDAARGRVREASFGRYLLFVTYFPHLIAGPVLHHSEMMPQFRDPALMRLDHEAIAIGLASFMLGLFKKVVLADGIAGLADAAFAHAPQLGLVPAWAGALAYTLQIYLDFSAYTDMAIGLSCLLGIRLPANFESPYKSTSIIDFWRRWHMTLSRFLRDYLYIPLGGSRRGPLRRHANLLTTMLLGGFWHGAGWNFLAWGGLHGVFLVVNHGWRHVRGPTPLVATAERLAGWALTFGCVTVAWVFFRAQDFTTAGAMLAGMAGWHGLSGGLEPGPADAIRLTLLLALVLLAPNLRQIMRPHRLVLDEPSVHLGPILLPTPSFCWRPNLAWAAACFGLFATALSQMTGVSQFLYFRF